MRLSAQVITIIEWIAAIAGLANVYLLTRQTLWAWPAGLLSVFLYAFVFYHNRLYSDVILHVVFVVLNIYGWYRWSLKKQNTEKSLSITRLKKQEVFYWSSIILFTFIIWGYLLKNNTKADYAYADAFILTASLVAQYFLAIKKLENWIIWILVDLVAITVYFLKELYVTSTLYTLYLLLCVLGFWKWRKEYSKIN